MIILMPISMVNTEDYSDSYVTYNLTAGETYYCYIFYESSSYSDKEFTYVLYAPECDEHTIVVDPAVKATCTTTGLT